MGRPSSLPCRLVVGRRRRTTRGHPLWTAEEDRIVETSIRATSRSKRLYVDARERGPSTTTDMNASFNSIVNPGHDCSKYVAMTGLANNGKKNVHAITKSRERSWNSPSDSLLGFAFVTKSCGRL